MPNNLLSDFINCNDAEETPLRRIVTIILKTAWRGGWADAILRNFDWAAAPDD
jgi:hypothetical protein